jgi:hypothetical protein
MKLCLAKTVFIFLLLLLGWRIKSILMGLHSLNIYRKQNYLFESAIAIPKNW